MEQSSFSFGQKRIESKKQKKERLAKEKEWKRKEERRKKRKTFKINKSSWRLLPSADCDNYAFWIDTLPGKTYIQKLESLFKQQELMKKPTTCRFQFPPLHHKTEEYLEKMEKVKDLLQKNQDLRWKLKCFFMRWFVRKLKKANDVDPFTLEPFKEPITVMNFKTRVIYTFEAHSYMKDVTKRLLNNDGHLTLPLISKNPLTNESFLEHQIMGLLKQCLSYGHTSWPIEAYISCGYNMLKFSSVHSKPLRLHALHATMAKVDDWDSIDTLLDYIRFQHAHHHKTYSTILYKWALHHQPFHEHIKAWRKLCVKYYEIDILLDDSDVKDIEYTRLENQTEKLCEAPTDLVEQRKKYLEKIDGSSSI